MVGGDSQIKPGLGGNGLDKMQRCPGGESEVLRRYSPAGHLRRLADQTAILAFRNRRVQGGGISRDLPQDMTDKNPQRAVHLQSG